MLNRRWLVRAGIVLGLAASAGSDAQAQPGDWLAATEGRGYLTLGAAVPEVAALNRRLSSSGHATIADTVPTIGGGGHAVLNRWILGAEGHAFVVPARAAAVGARQIERAVGAASGFVDVGYIVVRRADVEVYPLVGIGGGGMQLKLTDRSPSQFDEVLADPRQSASLTVGGFLMQAAVGIERFVVLRRSEAGGRISEGGLTFGLRAGYVFGPLQGDWKLQGATAAGGPDMGITGPYVRVVIGGGGRRGR